MVGSTTTLRSEHQTHSRHPYSDAAISAEVARHSLHPERYTRTDPDFPDPGPATRRDFKQFGILALSTSCFLALAAFLLSKV